MPKRQAAEGEVTEGVAATYTHGEGAAAEVAVDLRDGIHEMVEVLLSEVNLLLHGARQ
jgi:hypothetical protein